MENNFVTRRKIKHSDNHFDIEELRTDEDGNSVWAVTFCSEDNMTQFSKHDLAKGNHLYFERGELIDDALFAELNHLPFPQWKSDRLAEVSEQIRLIENITLEAQGIYVNDYIAPDFKGDLRTEAEKAADADWQDEQATRADLRTGFQQF